MQNRVKVSQYWIPELHASMLHFLHVKIALREKDVYHVCKKSRPVAHLVSIILHSKSADVRGAMFTLLGLPAGHPWFDSYVHTIR